MKKKSCLTLAILLCMLQIIAVFAVVPASAAVANQGRSYNVYKTEDAITLDGVAEDAWNNIPWSDYFVNFSGTETAGYQVRMKATWKPVEDNANAADLYLLMYITGDTAAATDVIRCKIDDGRMYTGSRENKEVYRDNGMADNGVKYYFWNGSIQVADTVGEDGKPAALEKVAYINCDGSLQNAKYAEAYTYAIVDDRNVNGTCTFEFYRRVEKPADAKILFDVAISKGYSWNGTNTSVNDPAPAGVLTLVDKAPDLIDTTRDVLFKKEDQVVASLNKNAEGKVVLPDFTNVGKGIMVGWKDADGKLWPVGGTYTVTGNGQVSLSAVVMSIELLSGASVLIEKPTALRFEVSADANVLKTLGTAVQEKGIVLAKTADLTAAITEDQIIAAAELDTAKVAYEKIVLADSTSKGLYYAVKENISDVTVAYSACAYVTVKYADDSVKSIAVAGYTAENNSRSVKSVSEAAYADRGNVRAEIEGVNYKFKVSKDYAIGDYTLFSYSPYTEEQLDVLAEFKK